MFRQKCETYSAPSFVFTSSMDMFFSFTIAYNSAISLASICFLSS